MKTEKLKLKTPKIWKVYNPGKPKYGFSTESLNTDPTTACTTSATSTHVYRF